MTSRSETFIINGLQVLLALTSFVLGAIYLSRIINAYFSRYSGFNISYLLSSAFSLKISLNPLPLELPLFIGFVVSFTLIYICYYLLKISYSEFKKLEETQFLVTGITTKTEEEE
ncbi:MAG: hypothetical protein ACTSW1_16720 [Candidatus Hodarchaeales archaeon]